MYANHRRKRLLLACVLQVALAAVSLVAVATWLRPDTGDAAASSSEAPSLTEVSTVLAEHSAAVLRRDRAAFAAGLDPAEPAAEYRVGQLAAFDNMADVPLASWSVKVDLPVTSSVEIDAAGTRVGASATLVKVDLSYALKDVDPAPTHHSQWLTLVHRDGRTVISGDSDLAGAAGVSWKGPWDFGKVDVFRGRSSLVLAHPKYAAQMTRYAGVVDRAVAAVSTVWGNEWTRQVAVVIPDSQAEMTSVIGNDLVLDNITAVSAADSTDDPNPRPTLGQRVVLNPANVDKLTDIGRDIVLRHEVTLIATRPTVGASLPTWLMEGFAEYVANLGTAQPVPVAAAELAREVATGAVPTQLPTADDFNGEDTRLAQTYEESWLACRFIADRVGQAGLLDVFRAVAQGTKANPPTGGDQAFDAAIQSVLGLSHAGFVAQWSSYLRTTLG